ncbi:MAG: hypothetical protein ACKVQW_06810 [Pyrinomonadaceae bacterium]
MRELYLQLAKRRHLRLVFAALFLFVLLAEFGSHVLAHANTPHSQEELVSAVGDDPDEPCKHVLPCCDNGHSDQQLPTAGHQLIHNSLSEIVQIVPDIDVNVEPPIPFQNANSLFRESSPPFHPPRIS